VNTAARIAGDWDVAVIIDSDVVCDPNRVKAAVELARANRVMVLPHSVRYDLGRRGAEMVRDGRLRFEDVARNPARFVHRQYSAENGHPSVSSVVVVGRELWDIVGGFDEMFRGWGYEDTAFAAACETFGRIIRMPGEVWHLWHPTAREGKRGTPSWSLNSARGQAYRTAIGNAAAIRELQASGRPQLAGAAPGGIPRVLHRVVPEEPIPQAEAWWARFEEMHPDWTMMTHRDPLEPADWPLTRDRWAACSTGAQLADLVRLEALLRWGGVYVDQDVEPLRPLDPLLGTGCFAAWEDERCVPNAVMGATPGHPAIRACLELALSRIPGDVWQAGPGVLTDVFPGRRDVLLLPPGAFYDVHYRDPERDALMDGPAAPWTFARHHYWGSWLPEERRRVPA
jgi:hypothetical protein